MRPWLRLLAAALVVATLAPVTPRAAEGAGERLLRWGYVVTYDPSSLASLRSAAGRLDFVSPGFYSIAADGQVLGDDVPAIDEAARQGGAKLVPMFQNKPRYGEFTPVLAEPPVRSRAIAGIVGLVERHGYDGVHLDFEGLRPEDRGSLTRFVADLADQLRPRGKLITVSVPSRVSDAAGTWSAPYDFAELGRLCDYVVIMTYAFRTAANPSPGSIAPIAQVERSAAYTTSQIPASKVLLGVGLWGYDWSVTSPGRAVTRRHPEIIALAQQRGGTFGFSEADQSAWLRYADGSGARMVWFEDARSVEAKLGVAVRHGLAGVAAWRLGQEDPAVWRLFDTHAVRPPGHSAPAADYDVPNGHFFTQTGGGEGRGYSVVDGGTDGAGQPIRFWSEFRRLGGIATLGYPVSQRYVGSDGYTYQAFQRGVLQWRPELGVAWLSNTFEQLTAAGRDPALVDLGIPAAVADDGSGGDWGRARATRLGWLTNPAIKAKYLASPSGETAAGWSEAAAIQLYGLPASPPVKSGPFVVQRFQRVALQLWLEDVPGMPARGSVVGILGGDLLKRYGLIPSAAAQPEPGPS